MSNSRPTCWDIVLTDFSRLVNIAVGVFMVLGGISNFFTGTWSTIILGAYAVAFGLGRFQQNECRIVPLTSSQSSLALSSFPMSQTTPTATPRSSSLSWAVVSVSCSLAQYSIARIANPSLVYIFIGSILLHDHVLRIIDGSLIGFIGLGYVALEFIPSIEPPTNMREADQGWGAEQV